MVHRYICPAVTARIEKMCIRDSDYVVQHRVLLGRRGFRKAALLMLDYLLALPPGREVVVLCQGRYDWLVGDLVFVLQIIQKLQKVVKRGTTLAVITVSYTHLDVYKRQPLLFLPSSSQKRLINNLVSLGPARRFC